MALFLICFLPLSILITVGVYFPEERGIYRNLLHGLYGLLLAVPVLLLHTLIKKPLPSSFLFGDLFSNVLVYRTFQLFAAGFLVYHIPFGFRQSGRDEKNHASVEWQTFLFFGTYYAAASIVDAVISFGDYHAALLFYIPVARLGTVLAAAAAISFLDGETGIKKALLYAGTLVVPFLFSLGYPLFYLKMYGAGLALAFVLFGSCFAAFHIWMRREYRPGGLSQRIPLRAR